MRSLTTSFASIIGLTTMLAACSSGKKPAVGDSTAAAPVAGGAASDTGTAFSTSPITPRAGGKVVEVMLNTDEQGQNTFTPSEIEAHAGDILRFTLKTGVHNVDFLPDSNAGKTGLPRPSDMLQLPGQSIDLAAGSLAPARYYLQCDPHAALGMKAHLKVEK